MGYDDFETFYRRNYASVYWYFRRARAADDEAHDLAQQVFANVWKSWARYRREARRSYLEKIALRVLLDRNRRLNTDRRRGHEQPIDDPALDGELITLPPDIEERERQVIMRKLIDRLPPITRECVLYYIDGYTYAEIGRLTRLTEEAAKTRLRDAKKMMKEDYDAQQK
jgi:RNA polymerase sigma factor (sigma-70 family)